MFKQQPLSHRRGVDFYCHKTAVQFQADPYERYRETVVRQLAIHYADLHWGAYPFQPIIDWLVAHLSSTQEPKVLLDVGCGVGRLLQEVHMYHHRWQLLGVDYSYNLLRTCHQILQLGDTLTLDYRERGLPLSEILLPPIPTLQLGLATADQLPLANNSIDYLVSTFLLDRLTDPVLALTEWQRVLRPGGQLFLVSPLNWQSLHNWQTFPDAAAITSLLQQNWNIRDSQLISVQEPLDSNGNTVNWQTSCWKCTF